MVRWLAQLAGVALVVTALADIFLTVLYARIGTAFLTDALGAALWRLFKLVAPRFGRYRNLVLSFCGSVVLVTAVTVWITALVCGFALIVWPKLGASVVSSRAGASTPTDFASALYYSGSCLTTAFSGDLVPRTAFFRVLVPIESAIGLSVVTLTLAYILEVFNAVLRRSTLAQTLHHATGGTGDAAEWIAGLGAGGSFAEARSELSGVAAGVFNFYESQHHYPILIYFRFDEPRYAVARKTLVIFDVVSLIRTALDEQRYAPFIHSTPVTQLWNGSMQLMAMMSRVFLGREQNQPAAADDATKQRWGGRFRAAVERVRAAGIATSPDEAAAAERYVALRLQWQCYVDGFTRHMQWTPGEIEPSDPDAT